MSRTHRIAAPCATIVRRVRVVSLLAIAGWLAACSPPGPPAASGTRAHVPSPSEMVVAVRAAGTSSLDGIDVTPLRDAQVEDLRARAAHLESSDPSGAAQALAQALTIVPGDPELLQQSAEIALGRSDWNGAEAFARQSYDRGPKLGSLCRRNWTTLRFVRLAHGDTAGVQAAQQQVVACTVEPPVRM